MGKNACSPDQSVAPVGSWQTQVQPTAPADQEPRCTAESPWPPPTSAWPQVGCWWSGPCCGPTKTSSRLYGAALGIAGLLVGGVQLVGAMRIPASAGQATWRGLRPRWPVIVGIVVIALLTAGVGMAAAVAITAPTLNPVPGAFPTPNQLPIRCPGGHRRDCTGAPWW